MYINFKFLISIISSILISTVFIFDLNMNELIQKSYFFIFLEEVIIVFFYSCIFVLYFFLQKNYKIFKEAFTDLYLIAFGILGLYFLIQSNFKDFDIIKIFSYTAITYLVINYHTNIIINKYYFNISCKLILIISFTLLLSSSLYEIFYYFFFNEYKYVANEIYHFFLNKGIFLIDNNKDVYDIKNLNLHSFFSIGNEKKNLNMLTLRTSSLLSNPISLCVTLFILIFMSEKIIQSKILKYFFIIISFFVLFHTGSRFIIIGLLIFLFYKNYKYLIEGKIVQLILLALILFVILFSFIMPIENMSLKQIYSSRLIFYEQFLMQIDPNYIIRYNFSNYPIFINIQDKYKTGPHSDLIFLISNYGLIFSFLLVKITYKIFLNSKLTIFLLSVSLLNGFILNGAFWVSLCMMYIYEFINSNSYQKQT